MLSALIGIGLLAPAEAAPRVVVSVAPVQALVASIMAGVGTPRLLVPSGASPHVYALRPSDARALEAADVIVLIDPSFTPPSTEGIHLNTLPDFPGPAHSRKSKRLRMAQECAFCTLNRNVGI